MWKYLIAIQKINKCNYCGETIVSVSCDNWTRGLSKKVNTEKIAKISVQNCKLLLNINTYVIEEVWPKRCLFRNYTNQSTFYFQKNGIEFFAIFSVKIFFARFFARPSTVHRIRQIFFKCLGRGIGLFYRNLSSNAISRWNLSFDISIFLNIFFTICK